MSGLTRRVVVASLLLALVIGAAFAVLILSIIALRESARLARDAEEVLAAANRLERLIIDVETGERGFIITGQEGFLEPWSDGLVAFPVQARTLEALVADNTELRSSAMRIHRAGTSYIDDYSRPLVEAVRRNDSSAHDPATIADGERRVDTLRAEFDLFGQTEHRLATEREKRAADAARRAIIAAAGGMTGSVLLIVVFAGYLSRAIVAPVRRAAVMAIRLAGGDLGTRMPERGVAEIGALERSFNTMATSLEENRDELSRLAGEQAALRRVATLVAQALPPPRVFAAVADEVGRLLNADATILLRYETDDAATVVAAWRESGLVTQAGTRLSVDGRTVAALVRREGTPARVDHPDGSDQLAALLRDLGVRSAVGAPISVEGRIWGVMTALSTRAEPFAPDTESRIADFTDLVATAIANAQARAELLASRARVVAATDEARRGIERDLHDGVQQRLVSVMLELRAVEDEVPPDQQDLAAQLSAAVTELAGTVDDLREIARGIHPAILSQGGLGPALRALARRSALPVELDVRVESRLPPQVEVAGYYVVAEALTNAAKHARAAGVRVEADLRPGRLHLSVRDDGAGGADPAGGSGLLGLSDRVQALGGTIAITSAAGHGTSIEVELPLGDG